MNDLSRVTGTPPQSPGSTRKSGSPRNNGTPDDVPPQIGTTPPAPASHGRLLTFLVRPAALLSVALTEYRNSRSNHAAPRDQCPAKPAPEEVVNDVATQRRPPAAGDLREVFISYSSRDKQVADTLCQTLEANGIRCWIAPRDLVAGADWSESIIAAIVRCRVMVLVLSAGSNNSAHVKREVERATYHRKILIPIRTEPMLPSPSLEYFVSLNHWFDATTPPLAPHFTRLAATIRDLCNGP